MDVVARFRLSLFLDGSVVRCSSIFFSLSVSKRLTFVVVV